MASRKFLLCWRGRSELPECTATVASCADALSSSRNDSVCGGGIVVWRAQSVCTGGCSYCWYLTNLQWFAAPRESTIFWPCDDVNRGFHSCDRFLDARQSGVEWSRYGVTPRPRRVCCARDDSALLVRRVVIKAECKMKPLPTLSCLLTLFWPLNSTRPQILFVWQVSRMYESLEIGRPTVVISAIWFRVYFLQVRLFGLFHAYTFHSFARSVAH